MNLIKNVHLIRDLISKEDLDRLENSAYKYARHTNLYFKIVFIDDKSIAVQARQTETSDGKYFTDKEIWERTKKVFSDVFEGREVFVDSVVYHKPVVDEVDIEWIKKIMGRKRISLKEVHKTTGIDKGNLSNWINGKKPMSQPVKTMFYFMFKYWDS